MHTPPIDAIYGEMPRGLIDIPHKAVQCSPLIPGSVHLQACGEPSVRSFALHAPPGTLERRHVLALALKALIPGGALSAFALKDKGGSRLAAELKNFGCEVTEESRAHHRIVTTRRPSTLHGIEEAIATGGPQLHPALGLLTQPGIFSWDRTDPGSALLLEHLPDFSGRGADLGCGIGILSRQILTGRNVTELGLIDIDRRAVAMAERNITDHRARFLWADLRDEKPALPELDFVAMNPPFHDAGSEDRSLGQRFIVRAAELLKTGGECWLVANNHLPYETLLAQHFTTVTLVARMDGFKVYRAIK